MENKLEYKILRNVSQGNIQEFFMFHYYGRSSIQEHRNENCIMLL